VPSNLRQGFRFEIRVPVAQAVVVVVVAAAMVVVVVVVFWQKRPKDQEKHVDIAYYGS
jgi:hypothetical protein